jgi:hypothetical protein
MTPGVDIELLADYVGGALEGNQERAIADLIATVPSWGRAYRALVTADVAIRDALATAPPEPIPADVAARLDAAFAVPRHVVAGRIDPAESPPGRPRTATAPRTRHSATGPGRSARRRRLLPVVGTLVAVLFVVAVGGRYLLSSANRSSSNSAGAPASVEDQNANPGSGGVTAEQPAKSSGLDYTPGTLPPLGAPVPRSAHDSFAPSPNTSTKGLNGQSAPPPALDRFSAPGALVTCLNAITTEVPARVGTRAQLYDLSRFQGQPAVIVVYVLDGLVSSVLVAGADCGVGGAHLLYRVPA